MEASASTPFPRSGERGPVEGASSQSQSEGKTRDFRALVSAAQLKDLFIGGTRDGERYFRALVSAAQLKVRVRELAGVKWAQFPRSGERGPVEGGEAVRVRDDRIGISALW